ncbi:MAG: NADH-quinone oxidoreductase subunit F, partial [Deltaproteobacteria bacterium]
PDRLRAAGGLKPGVARAVAAETGVAEAEVYGVGSFFHLLAEPDTPLRVCTGLSCQLAGADAVLARAKEAGLPVTACSCLAACDAAPAVLRERTVVPAVSLDEVDDAAGDWAALGAHREEPARYGHVGPARDPEQQAIDLLGPPDYSGAALAAVDAMGAEALIQALAASGLQGRGGAGFPAHVKWRSVCDQADPVRYVVLNADEGEPGTFKDREVLLRRPDRVVEGLAIAARVVGASDVYLYLRGAFEGPWRAVEEAIARFAGLLPDLRFHLHAGHGAYICGEETALLEALEGRRGMPRLKPPYPTERGLWGRPTLVHNVETIACVPAIVLRGGDWFRGLGATEPGSKLYCVSGHVRRPGVYELPLGVTLDALVEAAGGYLGTPRAFSPGGASSGLLPMTLRDVPLDYATLAGHGSMLGSAGVVVLNDAADLVAAVRAQLAFFEAESCGQCAPCRIGTRWLRDRLERWRAARAAGEDGVALLAPVPDVAWELEEGSICGLGVAAPLPLTSLMRHFPEEIAR